MKGLLPFLQCVSCSSSTCAYFVALQCCKKLWINLSPSKKQRAAEKNFLARLQRSFTCPTTISRVRRSLVERRPRVIKDKTPKNTTWVVLDHHPLYRTGRVSRAISNMFQHPFEALLDHAWGDTEPPVIRISSRKAMPHVVTRFQRSTRIL